MRSQPREEAARSEGQRLKGHARRRNSLTAPTTVDFATASSVAFGAVEDALYKVRGYLNEISASGDNSRACDSNEEVESEYNEEEG